MESRRQESSTCTQCISEMNPMIYRERCKNGRLNSKDTIRVTILTCTFYPSWLSWCRSLLWVQRYACACAFTYVRYICFAPINQPWWQCCAGLAWVRNWMDVDPPDVIWWHGAVPPQWTQQIKVVLIYTLLTLTVCARLFLDNLIDLRMMHRWFQDRPCGLRRGCTHWICADTNWISLGWLFVINHEQLATYWVAVELPTG